jgi:hypothetical protein
VLLLPPQRGSSLAGVPVPLENAPLNHVQEEGIEVHLLFHVLLGELMSLTPEAAAEAALNPINLSSVTVKFQ